MLKEAAFILLLPFLGTALGSAGVFFLNKNKTAAFSPCLSGFAAGVMSAASVWSLILPGIERSEHLGKLAFLPCAVGFCVGILFLILCDRLFLLITSKRFKVSQGKVLTAFAVTLHNLPEGMAVGAVLAAVLAGEKNVTMLSAFTLSLGVAIQNIPEGAIISMPVFGKKTGKLKPFIMGILSGAVEPLGGILVILAAGFFTPLLPYFLTFAAGSMMHVVMTELSENMNKNSKVSGILSFMTGFVTMMSLDVALG
ncbi:MAG: ZIP family metal transporter [Acutalibacteraceae bacterium]